ncbi:MAG: hypothetical protein N0E48_16125 [Candidatus Thiodiazotropha endolucinida]|nr:hypothetical protein [Candidatus Thiodiazotropha taylori]MCW4344859.1 hypothetical protein [Candidatus Thiodiazotropha endolucinida]
MTEKTTATEETTVTEEIPVLVTTEHRGVFFGYTTDTRGDVIELKRARNCIYWRKIKGFLALAESGPTENCRIGPAVDIELHNITCVAKCTPEAVEAWEKAPW